MRTIENIFIGFSLADALGVPVEFRSRHVLVETPLNEMIGYGTYDQPPGTWSDDSSLSFCLADSLCNGYDLRDIAEKFVAWSKSELWTARGEVFDIGNQTQISISTLNRILDGRSILKFDLLGNNTDVYSNGNGSLMRILPMLFFIKGKSIEEQFKLIWEVSALTHPHIRSAMACFIYLKFAEHVLMGKTMANAYSKMKKEVNVFFQENKINENEVSLFDRILKNNIQKLKEKEIKSSGYVLHTLEASIWSLLNSDSYLSSVFKAINLGEDTDTTACVVGGVAGMFYGLDEVPIEWLEKLARLNDIKELSRRFENCLTYSNKVLTEMKIKVIKGDITKVKTDAIVNAANTSLLGGGGVDGAIHRAGGKAILEDCMKIRNRKGGCKTGEAVITTAGLLDAKYVIHTVGPVYNGGKRVEKEKQKLANCYTNSLKLAEEKGVKSIAFPNISTGIYKFPKQLAAEIAINTIKEYPLVELIIFVCFDDENFEIYKRLLK